MSYFWKTASDKCRVVRDGKNWYRVEWKPNDIETPWQWFLIGTAEWLGLTQQDIEWANK